MRRQLLVPVLGLLLVLTGCGTTALSTADRFMQDPARPRLWEGLEPGYVPPDASWFERNPMATSVGVAVLLSLAAGLGAVATYEAVAGHGR